MHNDALSAPYRLLTLLQVVHIHVKTLTAKVNTVKMLLTASAAEVKGPFQDKEGVPPDQQQLEFAGIQLMDATMLWMYNIEAGFTIHLILCLRGGYPFPSRTVPHLFRLQLWPI